MSKEFLMFPNNKKSEKEPDFKLSLKVGDSFVELGGAWKRVSSKGTPFLSVRLSNPYKERKGYHLEVDKDELDSIE